MAVQQSEAQREALEQRMLEEGNSAEEHVQQDYFGFSESQRVFLPDGVSWVEFEVMNEGDRRKYLNEQNKGIRVNRATQDAIIDTAPGDERHSLLINTLTNWNLTRNGKPIAFSRATLEQFLDKADPRVIDIIETEVRLAHPWLMQDMTVEDIDREMDTLRRAREQAVEREAGNAG